MEEVHSSHIGLSWHIRRRARKRTPSFALSVLVVTNSHHHLEPHLSPQCRCHRDSDGVGCWLYCSMRLNPFSKEMEVGGALALWFEWKVSPVMELI